MWATLIHTRFIMILPSIHVCMYYVYKYLRMWVCVCVCNLNLVTRSTEFVLFDLIFIHFYSFAEHVAFFVDGFLCWSHLYSLYPFDRERIIFKVDRKAVWNYYVFFFFQFIIHIIIVIGQKQLARIRLVI